MRTLTDDVIAILEAGGLTVGDATGEDLTPPYVVVYPLTQSRDGTWGGPWQDIQKTFQITCEGTSREQAEWFADRCDALMLASALVVVPEPRADIVRDDTTGDPSRWKAYPRYRLRTFDT